MDLSSLPPGREALITGVVAAPGLALRLREMGLRDGVNVRVTHRAAFGGRVIALGPDRLALDAGLCRAITVEAVALP